MRVLQDAFLYASGAADTQKSRTDLEEGKVDVNENYTDATYSTFESVFTAMICARVLLLILSFKYLRLTKVFIYYNVMAALVWEIGLPHGMGLERINYMQVQLVIVFILDYFDFYPSIACIVGVHLSHIFSESVLYGHEITALFVIQVLGVCVIQYLQLFTVHIIMTKMGMIFVEAEIVRIGNDQILNNMKEGVVILHETSENVLFVNTAAK